MRVADAGVAVRRAVRERARRHRRPRRPALHRAGPGTSPGGPPVGSQRLRALFRRVPLAGGPGGGPLRPADDVYVRARPLRRRLPCVRPGEFSGGVIFGRAAQGLGAAITAPAALSIVTTIFSEGGERDRALGVWTAVAAGGGAAGFVLGGLVTDGLGWEWVFLVNVPVAALGLALTPALIPE